MSFRGAVAEGKFKPDEPARWAALLAKLNGKRVTCDLATVKDVRSSNQNRWYWGVIVPAVAEYLSIGRALPLSRDDAHTVLKSAFIGTEDTPLGPVPSSSRTLTVEQFSTYCEQIRAHAASEWGLHIPGPGEAWED